MITHHTALLNYLIERYSLRSYLEIGVRTTEQNFDKINCQYKIGVDPETENRKVIKVTSDVFFDTIRGVQMNNFTVLEKYDCIFIDGLHHADQVKKDFENSLRCLNDGGFIVIHDTLPENEEGTIVPRQTKQWWGDVYKFAMTLGIYNDIKFFTLNTDCGCTVVWKASTESHARFHATDTSFENYIACRKLVLKMVEPSYLMEELPGFVKEAVV